MDRILLKELTRFKRYRDELIHAEGDELDHHLRDFVREIKRNTLIQSVLERLPKFDVDTWWGTQTGGERRGGRSVTPFEFPEDDDDRLLALLDLAESFASSDPTDVKVFGFGQLFGKYKISAARSTTMNMVLRPLAELLTDRIREELEVANPAIRELAGVPLDRVPVAENTKIFLRHKSVDKKMVRPYYNLLKELGLNPWLDEMDMKAGDTLHREIANGFDNSCAVVFFITENFKDERWLRREVDHAVNREIERNKRFVIITLVFDEAPVPRPLGEKLWKAVTNEVDGVREIIRALPLQIGPPRWKIGATDLDE